MLVIIPVAVVIGHLLAPWSETWRHLADTILGAIVMNTLWLVLGVGLGVMAIGTGTAWLVTMCEFPGRKALEWALVLPLAVPAYVIAYTYTDLLQFAGPVQSWIRVVTGWRHGDYWFPPIRSLGGAIAMLVLVLYPYVYLIVRASFLQQSVCVLDVGRTLGQGPWRCFVRIALPMARPAMVAGTALALMETVADFGTVAYFGVPTFTTGIYKVWFSMGDRIAAVQLAALLLLVVLAILTLERASRGARRFDQAARLFRPLRRHRLMGARAWAAMAACAVPLLLGFVVPALVLARMALFDGDAQFGPRFVRLAANSFSLAATASLVTVACALVLGAAARSSTSMQAAWAGRMASLGYAVPGSIIAVGVLVPLAAFDNALDAWMRAHVGVSTGLLLTGTIAAAVFAYLVRFLAVAMQAVDAGFARLSPTIDGAGRSLGAGPWRVLRRIHVPLLRGSAATALLLVFVDVLKELPATLIMRPFNFDTLAVQAHNLAADERLSEASSAALTIVAVGLAPVILLSRTIARARPGAKA
jgi:iron(III) transport system permease protein